MVVATRAAEEMEKRMTELLKNAMSEIAKAWREINLMKHKLNTWQKDVKRNVRTISKMA